MSGTTDFFDTICRVCLKTEENEMVPLVGKQNKTLNCYGIAVESFANVSVNQYDELPMNICGCCLFLLKAAIKFKMACENSDRILKTIVSEELKNCKQNIIDYVLYTQHFPDNCEETVNKTKRNNDNAQKSQINNDNAQNSQFENDNKKYDTDFDCDDFENDNNSTSTRDGIDDKAIVMEMNSILNGDSNKNDMKHQSEPDDILEEIEYLMNNTKPDSDMEFTMKQVERKKLQFIKLKSKLAQVKLVKEQVMMKQSLPRPCPICNKVLSNKNTYRNHMQMHNGYRFICEHCGRGFPTKSELTFHLVIKHGTGNYLQCDHCDYKAPRKFDLTEHLRIHTGERPFACDKCGLTFRRHAVWRNHQYYHSEKRFQCQLCPKRFHMTGALSSHMNNVHNRRYMYACFKCGATYAKTSTVRRHLTEKHDIPREKQGKILRITKGEGVSFPEQ